MYILKTNRLLKFKTFAKFTLACKTPEYPNRAVRHCICLFGANKRFLQNPPPSDGETTLYVHDHPYKRFPTTVLTFCARDFRGDGGLRLFILLFFSQNPSSTPARKTRPVRPPSTRNGRASVPFARARALARHRYSSNNNSSKYIPMDAHTNVSWLTRAHPANNNNSIYIIQNVYNIILTSHRRRRDPLCCGRVHKHC